MNVPRFEDIDEALVAMMAGVDQNIAALRQQRTEREMSVKEIYWGLIAGAPTGLNTKSALLLAAVLYDRLTRPDKS